MSSGGPSDDELMAQLAAGDLAAFDALYERYRRSVFTVLLRLAASDAVAEDVLQETFLRLYLHRAAYRSQGHFRAWLYSIARNLLTDYYRRARRPVDEPATTEAEDPIGPAEWAEAGDLAARIGRAVDRLPPLQREVLLLSRVAGLTSEEVADVIGSTPGAVRVALHRALKAIRTAIPDAE